jgi:hypothetical protein
MGPAKSVRKEKIKEQDIKASLIVFGLKCQ